MVMCTCAFVACSDDDSSSDGNWTASKDAKILGTWVITSVRSTETNHGPEMGELISFYSNGKFKQGGDEGTFKYNNETRAFSASTKHMSMKGTATVSEDGETMEATATVTTKEGTFTYYMTFAKDTSDNGDDDGDDDWTASEDAEILGTWVITSVTSSDPNFDPFKPGPEMGQTISFKSDGAFTLEGVSGTFKYNNSTGNFVITSEYMSSMGTATVSEDGESMESIMAVTSNGGTVTYLVTFAKSSSDNGDDNGDDDDDDEKTVSSEKMVGTWDIAASAYPGMMVGKQMVFYKDGDFTYNGMTFQYTCEEMSDGRLQFELYENGEEIADGKFVLVSEGNVLNGEYEMDGVQVGEDEDGFLSLVLRKPGYTYPTDGIKGRWKITAAYMPGPTVGRVMVFGNNGELYTEGDPYIDSYSYQNGKLTLIMGEEQVVGDLNISGNTATFSVEGHTVVVLTKQ